MIHTGDLLGVIEKFNLPGGGYTGVLHLGFKYVGPDWCGSVGWASSCKQKGHRFDLRSEDMPGSQASSLVGGA